MRANVITIPFPSTERQYRDLCERIKVHWQERILPTGSGGGKDGMKLYVGVGDVVLDTWEEVEQRMSPEGFFFRIYFDWSTTDIQDRIVRDLLIQNLEVSIIPLVYFDEIELDVSSHDCSGGPGNARNCGVCRYAEDLDVIEAYPTRSANESIRQHVNAQ